MNKERAKQFFKEIKEIAEKSNRENAEPIYDLAEELRGYSEEQIIEFCDIAIESLEREDKLIELAEQNKWHTEQPQEDRQYLVTYYQECDLLIMCKWKNKQWYDTKGIALDNDRVVAWKKVEPYERKE